MNKISTEPRNIIVKVKLSQEEKDRLVLQSTLNGLSISSYIRQAIYTAKIIPKASPGSEATEMLNILGDLVKEHDRIRNDLDQIVCRLSTGELSREEAVLLIRKSSSALELVKQQILKIPEGAYGNDQTHRF